MLWLSRKWKVTQKQAKRNRSRDGGFLSETDGSADSHKVTSLTHKVSMVCNRTTQLAQQEENEKHSATSSDDRYVLAPTSRVGVVDKDEFQSDCTTKG